MNISAVHTVMSQAHSCAMAMMSNAIYMEQELPNVHMDESARAAAVALCSQLVGTKHDIVHEVSELDDLLNEGAADERIARKVALIMRWLWSDICEMHELVTRLEAAKGEPERNAAYVLVAECAANILNPFNLAKVAADSIAESVVIGKP